MSKSIATQSDAINLPTLLRAVRVPAALVAVNNAVLPFAWGYIYSLVAGPDFVTQHHIGALIPLIIVDWFGIAWAGYRVVRMGAGRMLHAIAGAVVTGEISVIASSFTPIVGSQTWKGTALSIAASVLSIPMYGLFGAIGAWLARRRA